MRSRQSAVSAYGNKQLINMILTFYGLRVAQCHCLIRAFIPCPVIQWFPLTGWCLFRHHCRLISLETLSFNVVTLDSAKVHSESIHTPENLSRFMLLLLLNVLNYIFFPQQSTLHTSYWQNKKKMSVYGRSEDLRRKIAENPQIQMCKACCIIFKKVLHYIVMGPNIYALSYFRSFFLIHL